MRGGDKVVRERAGHVLVDAVHLIEVANVVEIGEEEESGESLRAQKRLLSSPGRRLELVDDQSAIFIRHVLHVLRMDGKKCQNLHN